MSSTPQIPLPNCLVVHFQQQTWHTFSYIEFMMSENHMAKPDYQTPAPRGIYLVSFLSLRGHPSMDCVGPSFWCVGLAPVAPALLEISTCGFMHHVPREGLEVHRFSFLEGTHLRSKLVSCKTKWCSVRLTGIVPAILCPKSFECIKRLGLAVLQSILTLFEQKVRAYLGHNTRTDIQLGVL